MYSSHKKERNIPKGWFWLVSVSIKNYWQIKSFNIGFCSTLTVFTTARGVNFDFNFVQQAS